MNENIKQAFPAADLGASLKEEIHSRSSVIAKGIQHKGRTRRTIIGAFATTAFIAAGVMVGPAAYAVYRLNQIEGSLDDCTSMVRIDMRVDDNGKQTQEGRTVYANGKWRIERKGRIQVYEDGILWVYDSKLNQVLKFTKPEGPFGYNASGASVKSMVRDITSWQWNSIPSVGKGMLNGREVTKVTLDERNDKMVVYADPKTDMPIYYEAYRKEPGGKLKLYGVSKPTFNVAVKAKEFVRNFPATAKVIDVEKIKSEWAAKIESPVAALDFKEGRVDIRDYCVNERGHVFIVYSNGETAADRKEYEDRVRSGDLKGKSYQGIPVDISVKDSLGNVYLRSGMSFQPYMGGHAGKPSEWVVLTDGEILRGEWFYPVNDQLWKPREIEVKVSSSNESRNWTIKVAQPTHRLIAEWFRSIAIAPLEPREIFDEENRGRRAYFEQQGSWEKVVPLAHKEIQRLEEFEREHHRRVSKMDVYFQLYRAHKELGNVDDSRQWLQLAAKEPEEHRDPYSAAVNQQIIRQTMKREGL